MKYVVSKFNDDGSIYPVYECEDEEEAMKTAYACNGVYEKVSPSLTDNQQVVLEWFQNEKKTQPFATVADFFAAYFEGTEEEVPLNTMVSFEQLTTAEQFQVLAAFAEWGMEQEDKE